MLMRAAALVCTGLFLLVAGSASAQTVVGTAHDLTTANGSTDKVCVFCHTPHASLAATNGPLWNNIGGGPQTYQMYTSTTLDMTIETAPQANSLACLSCHDGQAAVDNLENPPNSGFTANQIGAITGVRALGLDLRDDHPISITYNEALDLDFHPSANVTGAGLPLYASRVECGTCHDVHDDSVTPFLRISNASSGMCTTCHIK